ncbi:NAD(P)-dependent oxidoreductase [Paenibacillus sp. FSL P4-0338]|uniref:NAD-dependent epimerase/dehydratase family protein n=1 Tax=Paenibacillus sp. FSL P4-0338 TaxID=2921635 RepID=UPI0030F75097
MKPKTILISGADGYIALHLSQMLQKHNFNVLTATRNKNGMVQMDFSKPSEVASLRMSSIDWMIHTVSPNEALYKTDPYRALSESALGIHAALDFCVANRIKNFIYFSSFHVLGKQDGKLTELTPVAPVNDYGLAHSFAEQTVQLFNRTNLVNTWIIRPSNLFGVPVESEKFKRWNLIPFLFCKEAVERNQITLMTPGNQLRNFVGVSDVCKKVLWILNQSPKERIIHAYGKETYSVLHYASIVQKIASEIYGISVEIVRPEGEDLFIEFEFTSILDESDIAPNSELDNFVAEMIKVLLTNQKKGGFIRARSI